MKVSVIMAEYNTEFEKLYQSIKSILNQTYSEFEFIIVEDGHSKNLNQVLECFNDKRIKILKNNHNMGLAYSLNRAIKEATGEYLVRMDTDDVSHLTRIEKQLEFIQNNSEYSIIGTNINLITEQGILNKTGFAGEVTISQFINRIMPVHPSVLYRRKDILEIGCYQTEKTSRCEDMVLWAEALLKNKRIYIMEDVLLDYRIELKDYSKRKLKTRVDGIRRRIEYNRKMGAKILDYKNVVFPIIASLLPISIISRYHRKR